MYEKRIMHKGLSAYRLVRAQTLPELETRANLQEALWAERWQGRTNVEYARDVRTTRARQRSSTAEQIATAKSIALEQTRELEFERENLEHTLSIALNCDPSPQWEYRKNNSLFAQPMPTRAIAKALPQGPDPSAARFIPVIAEAQLNTLDKLLRSRRRKKLKSVADQNALSFQAVARALEDERELWRSEMQEAKEETGRLEETYANEMDEWQASRKAFNTRQEVDNAKVDLDRERYLSGEEAALNIYIEDVLSQSEYPDAFPKEHHFVYFVGTETLILDFELPNQTAFPRVKEVKYVASRAEFQETALSETWIKKTYDETLYQIALRTVYELFKSDEINALASVVFNGWVRSIDKANGVEVHACVMSLEANKDEFLALNLSQVDPKSCFRKLKGVAASKLIELSPVKPLVLLRKEDARFVDGYAVMDGIDERTNLAAMDWLDFENLIREVFEKEFSKSGGEVRITQASRDGGVDAIAFDPDPIRGGKLVIQAKRYTNTVGVAAVRDLYGTVHNEGANKGILVTTSDFGPDAYAFAKDKPLTLISGSELLYLLSQHGRAARIDIADAKRIAAENSK